MQRLWGFVRPICVLVTMAMASGCSHYTEQTKGTIAAAKAGNIDVALQELEKKNSSKDKELLYYLEKGELLRLKGDYAASREVLSEGDKLIIAWENAAKTDPARLMGGLGSVIYNDTTMVYDGRDYEKVFVSVRSAMDSLALGDWDSARVDIKKMHEREAVISEFRAKELNAAKSTAAEKNLTVTSFKDLNGYPVETLNAPDVIALKNSYESAFANYLAGFVYEKLGESSLAAPGYRKAVEMRPNVPLLDEALAGLDKRMGTAAKGRATSDTLLVFETGEAPEMQSRSIPIPIPTPAGLQVTAMSWPVIPDGSGTDPVQTVTIDGKTVPFATLTDVNVMARRALSDEMPGIITRSAIRAISRAATQYALDNSAQNSQGNAALASMLIGLVTKVATVATEVADTRIWRTLPGSYTVARLALAPGEHKVEVASGSGVRSTIIKVSPAAYSFFDFRSYGANFYVAPANAVVAPPAPPVPAPVSAPVPASNGTPIPSTLTPEQS